MISVLTPIGIGGPPPGWALYSSLNRKYVLGQAGAGWDAESLPYGQTPAIVSGDELTAAAVTNEGSYPVTLPADGILSIDTGGDTSRQTIPWDVYYYITKAWAGGALAYIGNLVPVFTGVDVVHVLPRNATITAIPLAGYWSDGESDTITVSAVSGLFGTLAVVGNELTGATPDQDRIDTLTLRGTDIAGDYDDGTVTTITGNVTVPDIDDPGTSSSSASTTITLAYLVPAVTYATSETVPAGDVISQSPSAGSSATPFSTVTITVSSGPTSGGAFSRINEFNFRI